MGQATNEMWERDKIIAAMANPLDLLPSIIRLLKERQEIAKDMYAKRLNETDFKVVSEILDHYNHKLAIILGLISPESKLKSNEKS